MVSGMLRGWAIPRPVLLGSAALVGGLLAVLGTAFAWGGPAAALAAGMGCVGAMVPSTTLRPRQALALSLPLPLAAAVAVGVRGQPLAMACFVALCCLAAAPANLRREGLLAGLPTMAAVLLTVPGTLDPALTAGWVLLGAVATVALTFRLPRPPLAAGAPHPGSIWRHAVVMAVATAVVVYLVALLEVPHGYWVALTLTVVLRPGGDQTRLKAWHRIVGTVAGALLALLLVQLLPLWGVVVALAGCAVLVTGYAALGDDARQVVFLTPTVVLLGPPGSHLAYALDRAAATLVGALVAVALALALARADDRPGDEGEPS